MGKRRIKRHKIINKTDNKNQNESDNNLSDKDSNEDFSNIKFKIELKELLNIINSNNLQELLKLSSFLNNYNYELLSQEQDKREKEVFVLTSNDFILSYLNLLLTLNKNHENEHKIKYNIISTIIEIFSSFTDKLNMNYIYNKILSEIFYQYLFNYSKDINNINNSKNLKHKIILVIFDLFQLFIDIMKEEEKINTKSGLINYDKIISVLIKEYIFNSNLDKEIKNKSELLLFSLFSNFYIEMNDKNAIKILLSNIFSKNNKIDISSFVYFMSFYISINNADLNSFNAIIQKIIEFSKDINLFNNELNDFSHFLNEIFDLEKDNINNINISDEETKQKLNSFLFNCHTIYGLFKIYSDIIENFGEEFSSEDIFLTNISIAINKFFNKSNNAIINQCFNDNFISTLIKLLNNLIENNIESFFMDNNDCVLRIKEILNEMLVLILGIINNIINKLNKKFKQDNIGLLMNIIYKKLNKYKSNNDEEISLIILLLRNILEKKIINLEDIITENNNSEELIPLDYKLLFSIFNFYMNNDYIKINIIDIIALIYSTEITNDKSWYEIIEEINNLLLTLLYNEKNIEIASHVINTFMDIYQWDDEVLNKILKNSNVLTIMLNGSKNFKQKMENLYKTNEITEDAYQYISDTLTNMKRFIKYKKDI
jgi:hypothetical protein